MRLSEWERHQIRNAAIAMDPLARVFLYGSRTKSELKGGDIDLLVLSEKLQFRDKVTLLITLKAALGDQKIDLLIKRKEEASSDPFIAQVLAEAIEI